MFSFILFDAYFTSSLPNQLVVWIIFVLAIIAAGIIMAKNAELKTVLRLNRTFLSKYKKSANNHPASLYVESGGKFMPGIPFAYIYIAGIEQLRSIMHKRGFSDEDIIHINPDPGISPVISDAEMRSIEACMNSELAEQTLLIEKRMSTLGTITNTATSLGLLGTVYGVMESFMAMKEGGASMIAQVAPGISGALLTTVIGLIVAIGGTYFYNKIADMIKETSVKAETFTDELIADIAKKFKIGPG